MASSNFSILPQRVLSQCERRSHHRTSWGGGSLSLPVDAGDQEYERIVCAGSPRSPGGSFHRRTGRRRDMSLVTNVGCSSDACRNVAPLRSEIASDEMARSSIDLLVLYVGVTRATQRAWITGESSNRFCEVIEGSRKSTVALVCGRPSQPTSNGHLAWPVLSSSRDWKREK